MIYKWTCSCPDNSLITARWTLSSNQSINQSLNRQSQQMPYKIYKSRNICHRNISINNKTSVTSGAVLIGSGGLLSTLILTRVLLCSVLWSILCLFIFMTNCNTSYNMDQVFIPSVIVYTWNYALKI
jgi:hypothetical protein